MDTTKVQRKPVRPSRMLLLGVTTGAVLLIVLVVVLVQSRDDAPATQAPMVAEAPENTVNATAEEVATGLLEAYGAYDVERAMTYLADDAVIASVGGLDDPRLLISWLEATGYQQMLDSCESAGTSSSGSTVRCPFRFHGLRSGEIGRGPFGGSSFELVVRDGKIVRLSQNWEIERFSPQMWEPFARWVSTAHAKDASVMYEGQSGVRLTEESIRLWERHTQGYVDEVKRNRRKVSRASSVRSG
jgi:hypothetical protein